MPSVTFSYYMNIHEVLIHTALSIYSLISLFCGFVFLLYSSVLVIAMKAIIKIV